MTDKPAMLGLLSRALVVLTLVAAARASAFAQTTTCQLPSGNNKQCSTSAMTVSVTVPKATMLTLTNALSVPNNNVAAADFVAGFKASGTVSFVAKSNAAANVTLTSSASPATYSGMIWSTDGTNFTSPATVLNLAAASAGGSPTVVTFRTKLQWASDAPGSYTETLTFTITAP